MTFSIISTEWSLDSPTHLTWFFLAVIAAVLVYGFGVLEIPLWRMIWTLHSCRRQVGRILNNPKSIQYEGRSDQPAENYCREQVRDVLSKVSSLREKSEEFHRAWLEGYLPERDKCLGGISFGDFLQFDDLVARTSDRRMALALPGMLIALGILGTFCGLVIALPATTLSSQSVSELSDLREVVGSITGGLGLAFWTSIAGILCSLVFLFTDRVSLRRLECQYWELVTLLDQIYPTLSPAELAKLEYDQLTKMAEATEQMGTDLASKLADVMEPALGRALDAHFRPLAVKVEEAVSSLVHATTQEQAQALGNLVDQFLVRMNESLGNQFQRLQDAMTGAARSQETFRDRLESFSEKLMESAELHTELLAGTARAAETLTASLDRLEAISQSLGISSEKLSVASHQINAAAQAALDAYRTASEGQERLVSAMQQQVGLLDQSRQQLLESWQNALETAEHTILRIRDITKELQTGVAEHLVGALERFDSALAEALQHFAAGLADFNSTIQEVPEIMVKMEKATHFLSSQIEVLNNVLAKIENAFSAELFQNVDRAVETVARLEGVVAATRELLEKSDRLESRFAQVAEALSAGVSQTAHITGAFPAVERALTTLADQLSQVHSTLREMQSNFDGDGSLRRLNRSIEGLAADLHSILERTESFRSQQAESSRLKLSRFFGR